ncbi:MAG: hypothetical protein KAJ12_14745, partial [Bacteroidetes bacterium]|nr:hypothetical protein [Bacteroidota bacterium]
MRVSLLCAISFTLFHVSCAPPEGDVLRIVTDLPDGEVSRDQAIVLEFSRGVVPQDSVNRWTNM